MSDATAGGPVLVAVPNPDHVDQLVRTASEIARIGARTVRILPVIAKPRSSPF